MKLNRCFWCSRRDVTASEWEQDHHRFGWQRLCTVCAAKRLASAGNALLQMRKATGGARYRPGPQRPAPGGKQP